MSECACHVRLGPRRETDEEFNRRQAEGVAAIIKALEAQREKSPMEVIAKFSVVKVSEMGYSGMRSMIHDQVTTKDEKGNDVMRYVPTDVPVREIQMSAVYGGSEENDSFAKATPSGMITFQLNNPKLKDEFKPGQYYYVKFIPCE